MQDSSNFKICLWACLLMALVTVVTLAQTPIPNFPIFRDVASSAGLTLMNISGEGQNDYIIEANGNGAAFFDYDNDGDMDVLISNGSTLKRYAAGGDPVVALYENADGRFRDRTAAARLDKRGWASGLCVADYDNDGLSGFLRHCIWPQFPVSQQRQRHVRRTRNRSRDGGQTLGNQLRIRRLRPRRQGRSVRRELPDL